jgi:hypothetical protein
MATRIETWLKGVYRPLLVSWRNIAITPTTDLRGWACDLSGNGLQVDENALGLLTLLLSR